MNLMLRINNKIPVLILLLVFMAGAVPVSSLYASETTYSNESVQNDNKIVQSANRIIQGTKAFFQKFKPNKKSTVVRTPYPLPEISYCQFAGLTYDNLHRGYNKEIVPIADEILFSDFSASPQEYDIWDNQKINPYNISLVGMKDTIKIDVSNYCAPSKKHITSDFGFRKWKHHNGIDLKVHKGDTVRCAFDGVVRITLYQRRGYGYYTVVRHSNGLETLYAHLAKFIAKQGDTLKAGDPIGMGGSTGRSTGYHLHFEVRYLGNPINPHDIIDFENHSAKSRVFVLTADNFEYKREIDKIRYWTVKKGDTLGRISQKTGIPISKLCALNGITRKTILRIGRRIRYT